MIDNNKVVLFLRMTQQDTQLENKLDSKTDENLDSEILLTIDSHLTIYKSCK